MLEERNYILYVENVSLTLLSETYGTPLYIYSQMAIDEALGKYQGAFANINPQICYAVKANSNLSILRYLASKGCGFDIVSGGELARVLKAGGNASKTIFSGVGKSVEEIHYALEEGIQCFNVESLPELERINKVAYRLRCQAPVSLRINPDVDAKTHPYISTGLKDNKFGIAYKDAISAYEMAVAMPNLKVIGIDCHIGSQLTDVSPLIDACDRIMVLVHELKKRMIELRHIDLGGGVGISYRGDELIPDLARYANHVEKALAGTNLKLILEPGRFIIGNAGILLTRVEYMKQGESKKFAIVDSAMNDLMRPALYQSYHDIIPVRTMNRGEMALVDVVGPICESSDVLARDRQLALQAGDLLAIKSAGAYGFSMASQYNARYRPAEVWVSNNEHRLIRRRETFDDLIVNEIEFLRKRN